MTAAPDGLEGRIWEIAGEADLVAGLDKAFDYRGDVTIGTRDGRMIEGYVFDRRAGASPGDSVVRLLPKDGSAKVTLKYSEIASIAFSGRDTAAGKSWEAWVKKYHARKAAGETNIALEPEALD